MSDIYRFNPSAREIALRAALDFHRWREDNATGSEVLESAEKFVKFLDAE